MEKKILKIIFIIFLVLVVFLVVLIGYRASLVYKIYKANNEVFSSENIKIESIYNSGQWEKNIIYRKGNLIRIYTFFGVEDGTFSEVPAYEFMYDCDNGVQIDVGRKEFYRQGEIMLFAKNHYQYPMLKILFPENYKKTFADKFGEIGIPIIYVLKGYPHIENKDGRDFISIQDGAYIMYFDKETGMFCERYRLHIDGRAELIQKYNIEFNVVTEEDMDYGDLSEFYFWVSE